MSNLNGRNQGTKRDASLLDGAKDSPPHRRRLDLNGIPRGPKEQQVGEPSRKNVANGGSPAPVNPAFGPNSLGARMGLRTNNIRQPQRPPQQDDHVSVDSTASGREVAWVYLSSRSLRLRGRSLPSPPRVCQTDRCPWRVEVHNQNSP